MDRKLLIGCFVSISLLTIIVYACILKVFDPTQTVEFWLGYMQILIALTITIVPILYLVLESIFDQISD